MNDTTAYNQQRAISHWLRDLSPGALLDLILAEFHLKERDRSLLFSHIAPTEGASLDADLARLATHYSVLCELFNQAGIPTKHLTSHQLHPNGQLLDFCLSACANKREDEETPLHRLSSEQRTIFAQEVLCIQAILNDYRDLVSVALGGLQPPIAPGAVARHPATRAAGIVTAIETEKRRATLHLMTEGKETDADFPINELIVTGRHFPLPEAYWVWILVESVTKEQHSKLISKAYKNHTLWAYRWIYDRVAQRVMGLALLSRRYEYASNENVWLSQSKASLRSRVGRNASITITTTPRLYEGERWFLPFSSIENGSKACT